MCPVCRYGGVSNASESPAHKRFTSLLVLTDVFWEDDCCSQSGFGCTDFLSPDHIFTDWVSSMHIKVLHGICDKCCKQLSLPQAFIITCFICEHGLQAATFWAAAKQNYSARHIQIRTCTQAGKKGVLVPQSNLIRSLST